jgi:plastocyanin
MTTTSQSKGNKPEHDETVIHVMTTNPERQHAVSIGASPASSSKKLPALILALFVLVAGIVAYNVSSGGPSPTSGVASLASLAPAQVAITNAGFVPATISVKVGQSVVWTDTDTAQHLVASDPYPSDNAVAGFDSQTNLSTNDHYSFIFYKPGTYTYHDDLNPYSLKGTVIVKQ